MERFFTPQVCLYIARILAFLLAVPVHEVAHGWVSDKLGDPTARSMGRLSLNPIRHFDLMGFMAMLLIGVGWAKPVPVNPNYYKNRKWGMAATAVAGPASNLLLALATLLVSKVFQNLCILYAINAGLYSLAWWMNVIYMVLLYFAIINVTLALFNLIPIPPLDGSRILGLVLPEKIYFAIMKKERYIMAGLLIVLFIVPRLTGYSPINGLLSGAATAVINGMDWLLGFVDLLFARLM